MDLQRQLDTLEAEIRKLRKRVRNSEYQDQLTLDAPLIAQSVAGEEREIVKGYDGPLYDVKVDALSGLAAADDSFTLISSQVNDTTDVSALTLKATRLSGALIYDCKVQIYNSGDGSSPNTKIVLSPLNDWILTAYELAMPASSHIAMGTAASDPSSPTDGWLYYNTGTDKLRLYANGAWTDVGGGAMKVQNGGYYLIPAGPATGTTVTSSSSADTYGSWTEMRAASGNALYIVGVMMRANASALYTQLDIGTGAAASETSVGETKLGNDGTASSGGFQTMYFPYPIAVAANTRIACRTADEDASARNANVTLIVVDQADVTTL